MCGNRQLRFCSIIILIFLSGCAVVLPPLNPVATEDRIVTSKRNIGMNIVFKDSMVWYDKMPPTRSIKFPSGVYQLEAEDDEYYYFKATHEIDYRVFEDGKEVERNLIPGGLYLSKKYLNMQPAGAYCTVNETHKILTWKLGRDFLMMEGSLWEKNLNE